MALTDIARQLKETFEGFNVVGIQDEVSSVLETEVLTFERHPNIHKAQFDLYRRSTS